ncbi:MAG: HlyD family efflux transporter periplasmic adaptor subunit, partial [Planctomycetes bacterium]|nr:HlyD family efflux transporter periplasmic adaptor subunit [Planctomycetota bacterium]
CAYVDATAAWGFPNKWNRLVVSLAGMYVESIVASVAVFVWAFTDPGLLHSVAYNAMLTASIVTVLFNINPLMRYDGYYILADLIEIPNLRQKAAQTFASVAKRIFLGLRTSPPTAGRLARSFLLAFGVASLGYRALLLIGIGAALAYKCGFIGLMAACFYVALAVVGAMKKLLRYLWKDEETAPRRKRAVACGVCTIVGLPLALLAAPSSPNVFAPAVVAAEKQATVRTDVPGFIERIGVEVGQSIHCGDLIAWLGDDDAQLAVRQAECDVEKSQLIIEANLAADPATAAVESELLSQYERVAQKSRADLAALSVRAPFEGRVVQSIRRNDIGRFLHKGEPLATIISGRWQAQVLLSEHEFASVQPRPDGRVWFRSSLDPTREFRGRIVTVEPGGARVIQEIGLTQLAGAGIAVDPLTNSAERPFFRVTVELEAGPNELQLGQTGSARFRGEWEPLGVNLIRSVLRFSNRILAG